MASAGRLTQTPLQSHHLQAKTNVEVPTVVLSATRQARNGAFDPAHTRKIALAIWASVEIAMSESFRRERKIMAGLFAADAKIAARPLPLSAVWQDSATSSAKLRKNMGQLMSQSAIDLGRVMRKPRI